MDSLKLDPNLLALAVRQPWLELILRGVKTIEVRTVDVAVRGPIYLYAARKVSDLPEARQALREHQIDLPGLPLGMVLGTVELRGTCLARPDDARRACLPEACLAGRFAWHLANPVRFTCPVRPRCLPYGIWFYPFRPRRPGG
jgi:hypothetical protein